MHPSLPGLIGVRRNIRAPETGVYVVVSGASLRPGTPIRHCSNYAVAY